MGTYRIILNQIKKNSKKRLEKKEEDESSIKSRLNKRQALEATKKVFFCKSARGYCVTFFAQFNADQTYNFKKIVTKDWEEKYGVILVL